MGPVVVSGYFNPLHGGHIKYIKEAATLGDKLIVIVNNDKQQFLKKGKIIMTETERLNIIKELRSVDEVILSIDEDPTVCATLAALVEKHDSIIFCNGGDRSVDNIPEMGVEGVHITVGVGGTEKINASSKILK